MRRALHIQRSFAVLPHLPMMVDAIGWASALILLSTILSQVWKQWRTRAVAGVSKWLFIGQISASLGFVVYSLALGNWVFVVTNTLLLLAAITGQILFLRNKRTQKKRRVVPQTRV